MISVSKSSVKILNNHRCKDYIECFLKDNTEVLVLLEYFHFLYFHSATILSQVYSIPYLCCNVDGLLLTAKKQILNVLN